MRIGSRCCAAAGASRRWRRVALTNTSELISLMVGRPIEELFPPRNRNIGDVVLSVRGLRREGVFWTSTSMYEPVRFSGSPGWSGPDAPKSMRAIFGADVCDGGTVSKRGRQLSIHGPRDAIAAGIAYLPEDRKDHGLVLSMSGAENVALASLERYGAAGLVSWRGVSRAARSVASSLQFRGDIQAPAVNASGGNQQKLVIGKWVLTGSDVLIFDEPTRGIDIGAKAEVYRLIHKLAAGGAAIVVVSSELPELLHVCHRIIVMSAGRIRDELKEPEFSEQRILAAAFAGHMTTEDAEPACAGVMAAETAYGRIGQDSRGARMVRAKSYIHSPCVMDVRSSSRWSWL